MNLKKLLTGIIFLIVASVSYAEDTTDYIQIDNCTIVAGIDDTNEGIININLVNSNSWVALQFDLYLPDGIEFGLYNNDLDIQTTPRLTYTEGRDTNKFSCSVAKQDDGAYRFVIYNSKNASIQSSSDNAILKIRLIASDMANTGSFTGSVKNVILANSVDTQSGEAVVTGANAPDKESTFTIQVNAKIAASGYGSFSWPRALDFSETEVEVLVGTENKNGFVHLDPVSDKKVPANTGVVLKGSAGMVNPKVIADGGSASSIFTPTSSGTYTVGSGESIYALSTKNGKTGFYKCNAGVVVPKYKLYLSGSGAEAREAIFFDETTGIEAIETEGEKPFYTVNGVRIEKPQRKGVYIQDGKKIIIK